MIVARGKVGWQGEECNLIGEKCERGKVSTVRKISKKRKRNKVKKGSSAMTLHMAEQSIVSQFH
jgi:hypothetical protein